MPKIRANGISIEYETFGDEGDSPLLLVMGLGAQMIQWDNSFCNLLAEKGHYVIRFDNRDVGLSEKMSHFSIPDMSQLIDEFLAGRTPDVPYTLEDKCK